MKTFLSLLTIQTVLSILTPWYVMKQAAWLQLIRIGNSKILILQFRRTCNPNSYYTSRRLTKEKCYAKTCFHPVPVFLMFCTLNNEELIQDN